MNINHAAGVVLYERPAEDEHETGEYDQSRRTGVDCCHQCGVKCITVRMVAALYNLRGNTGLPRSLQALGIRPVTDNCAYVDRQSILHAVDNCLQVAAATRDQDDDGQ